MNDRVHGLYMKWNVTRADGSSEEGGKHEHCKCFVLDINHDPFAVAAMEVYASQCAKEYPFLSADILKMLRELDLTKGDKK